MLEGIVEALSPADIAGNVALSASVGWPDTHQEWQAIYDAARVLGVRRADGLVAQGALCIFESAGSIAKMVVAPAAQRQGLGTKVFDRLLHEAEQHGLSALGLVATPLGQAMYATRGFRATGEVAIILGTPRLERWSESKLDIEPVVDVQQLLSLERRFMAGSRAAVLRGRLSQSCASAVCSGGFALATPQGNIARVGPIIAEDEPTARALTLALAARVKGPMRFDIPGEKAGFRAWLSELGLLEKGVHLEMALGSVPPWHVPARFALATQAWG